MDTEDEVDFTCADVAPLVVKTYKSFTLSLGVVAVFLALMNMCFAYMRQITLDWNQIRLSITNINSINHFPVWVHAVKYSPNLQGQVDLYLLNSAGCRDTDFDSFQIDKIKPSIIMIAEGGCSLHSKIANAKQSGFSAVLVYNLQFYKDHLDDLDIFILYVDPANSKRIISLMSDKRASPAVLQSNLVKRLSVKIVFLEIIINLIVIYVAELIVLTIWLLIYAIFNIILYRNFKIYQLIVNGCLAISESSSFVPKLQAIPFPEKILDQQHIKEIQSFHGIFESDIGSYHDSCSICLEEFQVSNKVRSLPCRHLFHTLWYVLHF
jgi:hypothetical protein